MLEAGKIAEQHENRHSRDFRLRRRLEDPRKEETESVGKSLLI
jgi:hypothetical protein